MPSLPLPPPTDALIRPRERRTATVLTAGALALMAAGWWRHAGDAGGMIDIDRATPLTAKFQVNVNQADWPELMQLPGVGRTLAERLIAEREERGEFQSVEELTRVDGIGPRTIERIRPYLLPIADEAEVASR
jgi:competence protein ComEA